MRSSATRRATEHASREELFEGLAHLLTGAGNATLMTQQLRHALCDHAAGNYRILTTMAAELLAVAPKRELPRLDEKLYLEVFAQPDTPWVAPDVRQPRRGARLRWRPEADDEPRSWWRRDIGALRGCGRRPEDDANWPV